MSIQLSANSFLQMLARSELLNDEQLRSVEKQFAGSSETVSANQICDWLLKREIITEWHAEKLLQAKFRGFFLGSYKLLRRVARGGMSTIYSARHKQTGDVHALKVLPLTRANQASYLPRFQREAELTQRLQHPNIVRVFGIFSDSDGQDAVHFMAMELLEGRDLFDMVNAEGPLPCRHAAEFIRQAATGLEYAHKAGLVHRDIKPGNLFLTADRTIRILDLGLAQDFDSEENLTREFNERVLGTADYLAPEQAADFHTADQRADIYGLGCTLYFLLTGQPPFTEGTLVQRLVAHQTKTPPPVSQFRSDIPDELNSILTGMMTKNRDQRIATAAEVADRLSLFLAVTRDLHHLDQRPEGVRPLSAPPPPKPASSTIEVASRTVSVTPQAADTKTSAGADYAPFHFSPSFEVISDDLLSGRFLAEFSELLRKIELECDSPGALSSDPRSTELLTLARSLRERATQPPLSQIIVATVPIKKVARKKVPKKKSGIPFHWILVLSFLVVLICITVILALSGHL